MKTIVLVKQVPDTETKIRISGDKKQIEKNDIKFILSPYDEFAIEEAIKLKETLKEGEVTVLTLGPDRCVEALRTALAMGADHAIHIKADETVDLYVTAKALAEVLKKEGPKLVFTGKQAIDGDQAATFGFVAEFLDWPSASVLVSTKLSADKASIIVEREVEGGTRHIIQMSVPCVLAVNKGINTPRYASLPGIMKAKKKEIKTYSLADLGLASESPRIAESDYQLPPERQAGKKLSGDAAAQSRELVKLLREESKVI